MAEPKRIKLDNNNGKDNDGGNSAASSVKILRADEIANNAALFNKNLDEKGDWLRKDSEFRHRIARDNSTPFAAEAGRYIIVYNKACPWSGRVMYTLHLLGLSHCFKALIGTHPILIRSVGWQFTTEYPDCTFPSVMINNEETHVNFVKDLYILSNPQYTDTVTVPIIWDTKYQTIVNNESADIIEMLNSEFKHMRQPLPVNATVPNTSTATRTMSVVDLDICPAAFARERAEWNKLIYAGINNGAYRAGFAASQEVYERFCNDFFDTLAKLEEHLSKQRYMVAPHITDVDIRLFQTLVRLHPIYQYHFRLNKKTIHEYPSLFNYLCELYALNGTGALVVDLPFCKYHYFYSHRNINPFGIIPLGPAIDYAVHHNRHSLN